MESRASFSIGSIPIMGRSILSPMAGISDHPYRLIVRQFGAAYSITEFISALDVINGHPYLVNQRVSFSDRERPIAFQIFDDQPERLLYAAQILTEYDPDIIDINLGCSVKSVSNRGAGAGLLREPKKVAKIFASLSSSLDIPVTAKIRLGWDHLSKNYQEIAHVIEDNGGQAIAIHARTRRQGYSGKAEWSAIGEIKAKSGIPIIGNGDIKSVQDIDNMLSSTECDAVMIGREAIGNPWIFKHVPKSDIEVTEIIDQAASHLSAMLRFYGEPLAYQLFRKHAGKYFDTSRLTIEQRRAFFEITNLDAFIQITHNLFVMPIVGQQNHSDGLHQ